jgi:hypothetical protein
MSIRTMLTIAVFMLAAFLCLHGIGAPEWAAVFVSVAVGEVLWSKERKRAEQEDHNMWLRQVITLNAMKLETKLDDLITALEKVGGDVHESNSEHETQIKPQLM